jgi:hypothetical protein
VLELMGFGYIKVNLINGDEEEGIHAESTHFLSSSCTHPRLSLQVTKHSIPQLLDGERAAFHI